MSEGWRVLVGAPARAWLARLDPRAKLVWFGCCFALTAVLRGPAGLALVALAVLGLAWRGGVLQAVLRALGAAGGFVALIAALDAAQSGLASGLLAGARLGLAVAAFSAFFLSTPPEELALALVRLGVPYSFAFILATGARFVPTVARETGEILDAYRARGVPADADLPSRARTYVRILPPLVISTVARSFRLAEAMEARAFGYAPRRTPLRELRLRPADWALMASALALAALAISL